jgi:hypothetical protein
MKPMDEAEVPLERYAAVVTALGEGYPLAAVLEHEGLSLDAWEATEKRWVFRLQQSADGDLALFDAFDRTLAVQRARFSRALHPLDEDLDAFLALDRHLAAAAQPAALLAEHGLFLGDWARLQERWAEHLAADADARTRAAAALASPYRPPLPEVRPGPRTLPPPRRPRAEVPAIVAPAPADSGDAVVWGLEAIGPKRTPTA